jgi:HAMP domain-containing protein
MKIRTRLVINAIASLIILFIAVVSLILILQEASTSDKHLELTVEMREIASERTMLREEYLIYPEERIRLQWVSKTEDLRQLLAMAQLQFTDRTYRELLAEIQKDFDATVTIFKGITSMADAQRLSGKSYKNYSEAELNHISQLMLKAYTLQDNINRLYKSAYEASKTANQRSLLLFGILIVVTIVITIFNLTVIGRDLARRIGLLREGISIIGAGKLDHRINMPGNDELCDLAGLSNEMAGKLQNTFVSIANLEMEIERRKLAEEGLEIERVRLQAALDEVNILRGIIPICSYCKKIRDDKGFWSQVEKYFSDHTEAKFSHGICPDCEKKIYEEMGIIKENNT